MKLKVVGFFKGALSGLRQFLATGSPLKTRKNYFYFTSKALFVLKIFRFLSWLFGHVTNGLTRKISLISKFMVSQPGKQTIVIHILPNISRRKGNQRNIFLEKLYIKWGGETSPRSFSEKSKLSISLDQ